MSMISPTHFIWVFSNKDRQPFSEPEPSGEEKAKAFDAISGVFAVGDCQDGKEFWNILHHADIRNEKGLIGTMSQKLEDGLYKMGILNVKGKQTEIIWHVRRIEK